MRTSSFADCQAAWDNMEPEEIEEEEEEEMGKISLTEMSKEFIALKKKWTAKAKICTLETLPDFIREMTENYEHDYGTSCYIAAIAAIAAARAISHSSQGRIAATQVGIITHLFIMGWRYADNKTGLHLIDYDDLLYPQYEDKHEKTIDKVVWASIRDCAKELMKDADKGTQDYQHWQSILDGVVPFGYKVEE